MNTYYKFAPNVFLAKCDEKHEKGEVIEVTTKYGKENESIVFNLIFERDGFYYYSIVRADGFNVQEWAKRRAERRREWSVSADKKSIEYSKKSNKDRDFLSLGTTWAKVLNLATKQQNMKEKPNTGTSELQPSTYPCRKVSTFMRTSWKKPKNTMKV